MKSRATILSEILDAMKFDEVLMLRNRIRASGLPHSVECVETLNAQLDKLRGVVSTDTTPRRSNERKNAKSGKNG